jgi:hypothetical protein
MDALRDLIFGARLALAGGHRSAGRLLLTALSTGLAVGVLLLAASAPAMWQASQKREARTHPATSGYVAVWPGERPQLSAEEAGYELSDPAPDPLYYIQSQVRYRDAYISGGYVQAGGPRPPVPPGIDRLPGPGEVYLSPALAGLLASEDGALLRPRFPQRVAGTIGEYGLTSPNDLIFWAGAGTIASYTESVAVVRQFGVPLVDYKLPPLLWLLLVAGVVTLLIPVLTVLGSAGRVGTLARDRRLAALRLVGAGVQQTRRIAAGEALLGALAGTVLGVAVYAAGRAVVPSMQVYGRSFFASDVRPAWPAAVLIVLLGPLLAVLTALFALRGAVIEPLGVVRQGGRVRRRLRWRLVPIVAGLLLLGLPTLEREVFGGADTAIIVAGLAMLLLGVPLVLPWLVERLIDAFPRGSVAYELGMRRLRLDGAAPARLVGGVAVVLAGAIALSGVLFAAQQDFGGRADALRPDTPATGATNAALRLDGAAAGAAERVTTELAAVPGARTLATVREAMVARTPPAPVDRVQIADCAVIRMLAPGAACTDGDVFAEPAENQSELVAGATLQLAGPAGNQPWTLPAVLRKLPERSLQPGGHDPLGGQLLATPGALRGIHPVIGVVRVEMVVDSNPDTVERLRNVAGPYAWQAAVSGPVVLGVASTERARRFATIRKGLMAGALVTLLLAGASMVVTALEQVMERRRPLAVLAAVGVPRSVLSRSILWQNMLPMAAALPVALATGLVLSRLLLRLVGYPAAIDWTTLTVLSAASIALVLVATAFTLPAVRRVSRPTELRTE